MRYEKIINREDKSKILITVVPYFGSYNDNEMIYKIQVGKKEYRKRNWDFVGCENDWEYRSLSMKDREDYFLKKQLQFVSEDEIYQAKIECWEKLKPQNNDK